MENLWTSSDLENLENMYPGTRHAEEKWEREQEIKREASDLEESFTENDALDRMSSHPHEPNANGPVKDWDSSDGAKAIELVKTIDSNSYKQEEEVLEPDAQTIRPKTLTDFVGQEALKVRLRISLKAALKRKEPPRHFLFHGPAGFGKTTLAEIIAIELGLPIYNIHAPSLETTEELISVFLELPGFACVFIDEIHRLRKRAQEALYSIMEDFTLPVTDGNRHMLKVWRPDEIFELFTVENQKSYFAKMNITHFMPKFTLIGATTEFGSLSSPLRDRFGDVHSIADYSVDDMIRLVGRTCKVLKVEIVEDAIEDIAVRARSTPRHANRLVNSCRDVADVNTEEGIITTDVVTETMGMLGVDKLGLEPDDRKILEVLCINYGGGPAGIEALSLASNISETTIVEVIEPHLLRMGLLDRTQKGRTVTTNGFAHLDVKVLP